MYIQVNTSKVMEKLKWQQEECNFSASHAAKEGCVIVAFQPELGCHTAHGLLPHYLVSLTGRISTLKISSLVAEISNTASTTCEVSGRNALFLKKCLLLIVRESTVHIHELPLLLQLPIEKLLKLTNSPHNWLQKNPSDPLPNSWWHILSHSYPV